MGPDEEERALCLCGGVFLSQRESAQTVDSLVLVEEGA